MNDDEMNEAMLMLKPHVDAVLASMDTLTGCKSVYAVVGSEKFKIKSIEEANRMLNFLIVNKEK